MFYGQYYLIKFLCFPLKGRVRTNKGKSSWISRAETEICPFYSTVEIDVLGNSEQLQNDEQGGDRLHPQCRSGHL